MKFISKLFLLFFALSTCIQFVHGETDAGDAAALRSLMGNWENSPPSWGNKNDPCGAPWEGVTCENSRVTLLQLSSMGLKGTLSSDISQLSQLHVLDLSYNRELGGLLSPSIGNLKQINTLILAGCSFSGIIPNELGGLKNISFLALNSNKFTGKIPPSIGLLPNLYWLDIADNQLTGPIPVSSNGSSGLDLLINIKHFHFNKNQLSGTIPSSLFSSNMKIIHLLLDSNKFTGQIPESIGLVTSLEVLRLDRNSLTGPIPSTINNLIAINELNLANNQLSGPPPNLTGMNLLNYVDLSNNSFDSSEAPAWFSTIQSLTALVMESGGLHGNFPTKMLSFPQLQQVLLSNNAFNGTLDLGDTSSALQIVNFQNNAISSYKASTNYNQILVLVGNPVCTSQLANSIHCSPQQMQDHYSTSLSQCASTSCSNDLSVNPQNCACAYPYQGLMVFRAPFFRDVTNMTRFQGLEMSLWSGLSLKPGSVYLSQVIFNGNNYLEVQIKLFHPTEIYFSRLEIQKLGFSLSNQTYKPPAEFGPYFFIANSYNFPGDSGGQNSMSIGAKVGIAVGCIILLIILVLLAIYAIGQKKRAERALEQSKPFASWVTSTKDNGSAPQLKGTRWFSFDELKRSTKNFSDANEIGSGGYGKVYKGMLSSGDVVAVKRSKQGSMQGGHEFKTEIELLSRVHHKNLVCLVGFCFEQGEKMLVYEYISNGTLRESLTGKSGIHLDWVRRLKIALGSARGLAYLHELANPPIIHRDVKSTNILLDESLTAKVADFGLSKLVSDSQGDHISTQVKGTLGYLDPEYYMTQQLTEKSDVYSFGVVMLELITSKQPIENGKYIVREVRLVINDMDEEYCGLKQIIDPTITKATNLVGFKKFVELSMKCVSEAAANRPTMNEVVKVIETILQNEGLNTNSNSTNLSAAEFGYTKGAYHPYDDSLPLKDMNDDDFESTGRF